MPFGMTFGQMMELANEVPGLVDDVKKVAPKFMPVLEHAAASIERVNANATLDDVNTAIAQVKSVLPAALVILEAVTVTVRKIQEDKLSDELVGLIGDVQKIMPDLPPMIRKVNGLLKILATSDTADQAAAKVQRTDWQKVATDRGGSVGGAG